LTKYVQRRVEEITTMDDIENRVDKGIAKPEEEFIRRLFARHLLLFFHKTMMPDSYRATKLGVEYAKDACQRVIVKFNILQASCASFHTASFFPESSLAKRR